MTRNASSRTITLLTVALFAVSAWAWFLHSTCTGDGRESPRDKTEWSILQALEATHRDSTISTLEFTERDGCRIICPPCTRRQPHLDHAQPASSAILQADTSDRIFHLGGAAFPDCPRLSPHFHSRAMFVFSRQTQTMNQPSPNLSVQRTRSAVTACAPTRRHLSTRRHTPRLLRASLTCLRSATPRLPCERKL
jgi:hypothetical protein